MAIAFHELHGGSHRYDHQRGYDHCANGSRCYRNSNRGQNGKNKVDDPDGNPRKPGGPFIKSNITKFFIKQYKCQKNDDTDTGNQNKFKIADGNDAAEKKAVEIGGIAYKPGQYPRQTDPRRHDDGDGHFGIFGNFFADGFDAQGRNNAGNDRPKIGLMPITKPAATPARDVWESASPIMDKRFNTMITPMQGTIMASKMPTINALCMKSYANIAIITSSFRR